MRKIVITIFLILTFLCSTAMSETADDWFYKASALWNGEKCTDPQKAIEYLNNSIKLNPNEAVYYNFRGKAYDILGQYQSAIKDYSKAIILSPNDNYGYVCRGLAYGALMQYERAINDFNKAIRLKPDDTGTYIIRGSMYFIKGNDKLGCRDAKKACALGNCRLLKKARCH